MLASETCALDLMEAVFVRDIEPGEVVVIDDSGVSSLHPFPPAERLQCVFEYVYFARPDSMLWSRNVHAVRKAMGHQLAREHPVPADLVIPVPDSGLGAALGYAEESGIPYDSGLVRNHYVGRTFIEPEQGIRHFGVKVKLNPNREVLAGRRVVVVDDSIVRGTTSRKIVKMVRQAGAREVHMRISSPPIQWPCYYGIDTPTRKELIGSSHQVPEILRYLAADSLGYLSLEGMLKATGSDPHHFCHACFTGQYRVGFSARRRSPAPPLRPIARTMREAPRSTADRPGGGAASGNASWMRRRRPSLRHGMDRRDRATPSSGARGPCRRAGDAPRGGGRRPDPAGRRRRGSARIVRDRLDGADQLPRRRRRHRGWRRGGAPHRAAGRPHPSRGGAGRGGGLRGVLPGAGGVPRAGDGGFHRRRRHQAQGGVPGRSPRHGRD